MEPSSFEDPRDKWQHARRIELVRYANENGHPEITEDYPKNLIIQKLKSYGLPPPSVPPRYIGSGPRSGDTDLNSHHYNGSPAPQQKTETVEIDADELMALEFEARKRPNVDQMTWNEMRKELKARGIKLDRKWSMADVKARLNGEQNPS